MNSYTDEINAQIVLAMLKGKGVHRAILCPGSTNIPITRSIQEDSAFDKISVIDERSAIYVACGIANETGEPVVVSCTGATSSRNFMSGLTEAYYRKLPIIAIMSMNDPVGLGNLHTQLVDRSSRPKDISKAFVSIPVIRDSSEIKQYALKLNSAFSELDRNGGGPICIELITSNEGTFTTTSLPQVPVINRYLEHNISQWPEIDSHKRILIYMGAQRRLKDTTKNALERFVENHNAVVFTNVTSGYHGKYSFASALACQQLVDNPEADKLLPDLILHFGEMSGDYNTSAFMERLNTPVWRISPDGEFRQTFGTLQNVFQTDSETFLRHYDQNGTSNTTDEYRQAWKAYDSKVRGNIPDLPFSNFWIEQYLSKTLPESSVVHPSILSSMECWNYFPPLHDISMSSNVGGFGIDGCLSELVGASIASPELLHYSIIGDLSFFYDMNILGNRHIKNNLRILLINNNVGMTFKYANHYASKFGPETDEFIAAGGHFINSGEASSSGSPAQAWSESLGFTYLKAYSKEDFLDSVKTFVSPHRTPILFECFTSPRDEKQARETLYNLDSNKTLKGKLKKLAKQTLPDSMIHQLKKQIL